MIVAYLLLVHAHAEQAARLVAALPAKSPVFIHVDARSPDSFDADLKRLIGDRPLTFFVRRHYCVWGAVGIVRGEQALIDALVDSGLEFDYATLLSGADYPIKSDSEIESFFERHNGTEFIVLFRADQPNLWSDHAGLYKMPDRMLGYHLRFRSRTWRTPIRRKLPYGLLPYAGFQWWSLTSNAIRFISDFLRSHPKLMTFMDNVFIPDECLIQTVLGASPYAANASGDFMRVAIFDRPTPPYPAILKCADVDMLAQSSAHFARKFSDAVDRDVYALIDKQLRGVG